MKERSLGLLLILLLLISTSNFSYAQKIYKGSPMLAEFVKQGKLPPVEERLPEEPLVIDPIERIGRYGGTLRFFIIGADWPTFTIPRRESPPFQGWDERRASLFR